LGCLEWGDEASDNHSEAATERGKRFVELFGAQHNQHQRGDKDHARDGRRGGWRQAVAQG